MPVLENLSALDAALYYAKEYKFAVIPIYGVSKGACRCGNEECTSPGKHPWTISGLRDASTDPEVIRNLFLNKYPANVGVVTGPVSNIFVLDVDGPAGEASLAKFPELPETLTTTTGRGRHMFFRYPKQKVYSRSSKLAAGVDVKGEGGYVIVPPSTHYSGINYQFLNDQTEIAYPPKWLLDNVCRPASDRKISESFIPASEAPEWSIDQVRDMLGYIHPDCPRDDWIAVGMALHEGGHPLAVWDEWSRRGDKYKPGETIVQWKSFKHNGGITFGTLVHLAKMQGWRPEPSEPISLDDHPAREFLLRIKNEYKISGENPVYEYNPSLFDPLKLPGLIGDTVREIVETAQKPQPELALMNVLAALGAIFGRRYASPMDTRTNIYFVGIAPTGSGKDHSRRYIKRLMLEADLDIFLGNDEIISGQGLLTHLTQKPSQVMHIDEFGMLMESMTDPRGANHMRVASKALTELYSTSSNVYLGGQYADKKMETKRIPFPNLCIYATTTPEKYCDNLSRDAVASGELNRYIIIRTKVDMPERRRYDGKSQPSEQIVSAWANLYPGIKMNTVSIVPPVITVGWTGLDDRVWDMGLFEDQKMISNKMTGALWARYRENVIKIAMIFAITRNPLVPVINSTDFDIGEAIVRQAVEYSTGIVQSHLFDSVHERDCNDFVRVIAENGGALSIVDLNNKTKKYTTKQRNEILDSLEGQNIVTISRDDAIGKKGRPSTIIRLV